MNVQNQKSDREELKLRFNLSICRQRRYRVPCISSRPSGFDSTIHGAAVRSPPLHMHVVILRKRAPASDHISVSRSTVVYHCSGEMDPSSPWCCCLGGAFLLITKRMFRDLMYLWYAYLAPCARLVAENRTAKQQAPLWSS